MELQKSEQIKITKPSKKLKALGIGDVTMCKCVKQTPWFNQINKGQKCTDCGGYIIYIQE